MPTQHSTIITLIMLVVTASWTSVGAAAPDTMSSRELLVTNERRLLTARIENSPLQDVLQDLANRLAITVRLLGVERHHRLTTSFTDLPVEQGIERLLQGQDYAFLYTGQNSTRLKEVVVLARQDFSRNASPQKLTEMRFTNTNLPDSLEDQQPSPANTLKRRNGEISEVASKLESLVQRSDQDPTHREEFLKQATNDQLPLVRALAEVLLNETTSLTP